MAKPSGYSRKGVPLQMVDEMAFLYQTINETLSDNPNRVVQFISSKRGEGTSTIVRELAIVSVMQFNRSVLVIDAGLHELNHYLYFGARPAYCLSQMDESSVAIETGMVQISESKLFLSQLAETSEPGVFLQTLPFLGRFVKKMRSRFDFILIDAPSASSPFALSLLANQQVDGAVLVMAAEETRWPVAKKVKDKITGAGCRPLGVVFNKHRHHIPGFIYNRLK